jgi:hypothetical protein
MTSKLGIGGALGAICNLNESDRAVRAKALERFIVDALAVSVIPAGILLQFCRTGTNARAILDFIHAERECCPSYEYRVCSGKDTLDIEITGLGPDVQHLQTFYLGLARTLE